MPGTSLSNSSCVGSPSSIASRSWSTKASVSGTPHRKPEAGAPGPDVQDVPDVTVVSSNFRKSEISDDEEEGTRSEQSALLLCGELRETEAEAGWLREALAHAHEQAEFNERAAHQRTTHWESELQAERSAAERLRADLQARQEEQEGLLRPTKNKKK